MKKESRVLHSRDNPNVDVTECLLAGRINPNNTPMQYLRLNLNQDIHMEKLYMMTLQIAVFLNRSFRVAAGLVLR